MRQVGALLLNNTVNNFKAGNLRNYHNLWSKYTRDPWVLNQVQGIKIPLTGSTFDKNSLFPIRFDTDESDIMDKEIEKLIGKGVIHAVQHEEGEVISNIFLKPKKNGDYRMVLG